MSIQFQRGGAAIHLGTAAALLFGSFLGCAQVLGIHQWQDPGTHGSGGSGGAGGDQDHTASTGMGGMGGNSGGPTCADHVKNGLETDVDCGGDACGPCPLGKACFGNADCSTKSCSANICVMAPNPAPCMQAESDGDATCHDCIKNGPETDVDCGGDTCAPCKPGKECLTDADCMSGQCIPQQDGRAMCL